MAAFDRLREYEEAIDDIRDIAATFGLIAALEPDTLVSDEDVHLFVNNWLAAPTTMFDVAPRLSLAVLSFVTLLRSFRDGEENFIDDTCEDIDWVTLRRHGIIGREPFSTRDLSCTQWMAVLSGLADGWIDVWSCEGMGMLLTGLMHRLAKLVFYAHTVDIADDVRFYSELPGIAKRIKDEDSQWQRRMVRKQMQLCTPHELAEEPRALEALTGWRKERHLRPTVHLITYPEPILRDMTIQLRLAKQIVPIEEETRSSRSLQACALRSMRGAFTQQVMQERMGLEFMRLLGPGDHERYRRQCPLLKPVARSILQLFRPMRCMVPHENLKTIIADPMDPTSALTLVIRAVGNKIALTNVCEPVKSTGATLRFVGHKLACVAPGACYMAGNGVSPHAVIAKFMHLEGIAMPEGTEELEELEEEMRVSGGGGGGGGVGIVMDV